MTDPFSLFFFEAAAMMSDTASYHVLFLEFSNAGDEVVLTKDGYGRKFNFAYFIAIKCF